MSLWSSPLPLPVHLTGCPNPHLQHSCSRSGRCGAAGGLSQAAVATHSLTMPVEIVEWRSLIARPGFGLATVTVPSIIAG